MLKLCDYMRARPHSCLRKTTATAKRASSTASPGRPRTRWPRPATPALAPKSPSPMWTCFSASFWTSVVKRTRLYMMCLWLNLDPLARVGVPAVAPVRAPMYVDGLAVAWRNVSEHVPRVCTPADTHARCVSECVDAHVHETSVHISLALPHRPSHVHLHENETVVVWMFTSAPP